MCDFQTIATALCDSFKEIDPIEWYKFIDIIYLINNPHDIKCTICGKMYHEIIEFASHIESEHEINLKVI